MIKVLQESVRINEEAIIPLQIYIILEGLSEEYISWQSKKIPAVKSCL